jgi:hypothetical protein
MPDEDKLVEYSSHSGWDGSNYFGASLLAYCRLCEKYNYSLVYCESAGVNCFFVRNAVIEENNLKFKDISNVSKLYMPPKYGSGPNGGHPEDSLGRKYLTFEEASIYTLFNV